MPYPVRYPSLDAYRAAGKKFGNIGRAVVGGYAEAGIDRTPSYFDNGVDEIGSSPAVMDSIPENQTSPSMYPHYKSPTTFQRIFAPGSSAQLDQMNFQSQMAQAENAQRFQNQSALMDKEAQLNATLNTLTRNLKLTPEQTEQAREMLISAQMSNLKQKELESSYGATAAYNNGPAYMQNYKDQLLKQGFENQHTQAVTTGLGDEHTRFQIEQPYLNELYRNREETNATALRQAKNQEEFYRQTMPYREQLLRQVHVPFGSIVSGLPTADPVTGEPYNYSLAMPETKPYTEKVPNYFNGKELGTKEVTVPGSPAGFYNFGQLPTGQGYYPIERPSGTTNSLKNDPYEYRVNPITGQTERRLKRN